MKRRVTMYFDNENIEFLRSFNEQGDALKSLLMLLVKLDILDEHINVILTKSGQTGTMVLYK